MKFKKGDKVKVVTATAGKIIEVTIYPEDTVYTVRWEHKDGKIDEACFLGEDLKAVSD